MPLQHLIVSHHSELVRFVRPVRPRRGVALTGFLVLWDFHELVCKQLGRVHLVGNNIRGGLAEVGATLELVHSQREAVPHLVRVLFRVLTAPSLPFNLKANLIWIPFFAK